MVELVASNLEALYPSSSTKLGKVVFNILATQRRAGCSCKVGGVCLKIQVKDAEEQN